LHKPVKISVRHLVEFILRSGDIDSGFFVTSSRALEGMRLHQRVQKLRKKEVESTGGVYQRELKLSTEYEHKGINFCIEGRADGLVIADGAAVIEEIKSTLQPLSRIENDAQHWHWAQAKCYAYMYALSHKIPVSCSLIYGHVETGEYITFKENYYFDELEDFFISLVKRYWDFASLEADCTAEAQQTGLTLSFPFGGYREGQREMAVAVYAAIKNKKKLFAQAPTGIGKTMATLFSGVKALAEGLGEKIFYTTSKTVQRHLAEDALGYMKESGLLMRSVTLTAKDKICFKETRACNPLFCEYAKGHFDRVNDAILDCIRQQTIISRATVEEYARKHTVCPSEYALDLSLFCHVIICDYNHVYDPKAQLKRFFQEGGDFIILQDEAHNLIDRAREMFSTAVHRKNFSDLRRELGRGHPLYKQLGIVAKNIRTFSKEDFKVKELSTILADFAAACEAWFKENQGEGEEILPLYFSALDYIRTADLFDERYTIFKEPDYIRLFCLDPSYLLSLEQKKSRAWVFFSATLSPLPYFQATLSDKNEQDYLLRLPSPFPRKNLCLTVESRISTKYKHRDLSLEAVVESLHDMIQAKAGNYMAFFPSYAYLSQVYDRYVERYSEAEIIRQYQGTGNEQEFLAEFHQNNEALLGFVVLGGAFSEGIDLKGERLIGVAIVGVGLPLISDERNLIMNYFNFNYAYIYPGMNKVMQAAGRVIRSEKDRGVVLLIDSRYSEEDYRSLFPAEWSGYHKLIGKEKLTDILCEFWNS